MSSKGIYFRDPKSTAWFESLFSNWDDKSSFLNVFCHLWQFGSYGFDGFNVTQEEAFFTFLTENFQVPPKNLESAIQLYLDKVN